jgi:hypothetical protein
LPPGVAAGWHAEQRPTVQKLRHVGAGSLTAGNGSGFGTDPTGVASIGIVCGFVETIDGTIYRFAYHGLMKNKHSMNILDGIHVEWIAVWK